MDQNLSPEQFRDVVDALERGRKVEAVKLYREASGLSLAECVKAVEAIPHTTPIAASPPGPERELLSPREPAPSGLTPEKRAAVMEAIRRKQKIEAIKIYREATGLGLAESKEAVEGMEEWRGAVRETGSTFQDRTPLPAWDPFAEKKKGCFGMIAVLVGYVLGAMIGVW